jgi:hypothetical protein
MRRFFFLEHDDLDLFGDPIRLPCGRRGRPKHVATQQKRNKVMVLLALGWSNERIANAIHASLPTLRRYYFSELKFRGIQRDRFDAWQFEKIIEQVESGNVGAMRLLSQLTEKNDMMAAAARMRNDPVDKPESKLGAKEIARRAADDAVNADEWNDLLHPGKYH